MKPLYNNPFNNPRFFSEKRVIFLENPGAAEVASDKPRTSTKKPKISSDQLAKSAKEAGLSELRSLNKKNHLVLRDGGMGKLTTYEVKNNNAPKLHNMVDPKLIPVVEVNRNDHKMYARFNKKLGKFIGINKKEFSTKKGDMVSLPTTPKHYQAMMAAARAEKPVEKDLVSQIAEDLKNAPKQASKKAAPKVSAKKDAAAAQKKVKHWKPSEGPIVYPKTIKKVRVYRTPKEGGGIVIFNEGKDYEIAKPGEKVDAKALFVVRNGKNLHFVRKGAGFVDKKGNAYQEKAGDQKLVPKGKIMENYTISKTKKHMGDSKRRKRT